MSDTTPDTSAEATATEAAKPKSKLKIGGLGPKAQKLQALRDKAAQQKSGQKLSPRDLNNSVKGKDSFAGSRKTTFQRKAV